MYDLTIIEPVRWGMAGGTLQIRDTAHDGMNVMHKLHERRDWIAPHKGRAHHATWCADVVHPDMRLIAAAPDLLAALEEARESLLWYLDRDSGQSDGCDEIELIERVEAAIAAATGEQP